MGVGVDIQQIPETPYRWMIELGDELSKMFRASGQPILQCQAKATDNVESYITKCTPANTTFLSHLQRVTRKVARQKLLLFQKSPTITVITGMTVSNPHHEPRARGMPSSITSAALYTGCRTSALQERVLSQPLEPGTCRPHVYGGRHLCGQRYNQIRAFPTTLRVRIYYYRSAGV